ncbi:DUF1294 domain-containing protein [Edaphobacillus lindanitolerans]|uniref:Uncharacterized membrane protein YsdA, DUF1294 family n=1 Tax=Edaphobacillus lindanitolerans TaxID=550447 RepID=A0A1U7PQ73_9BACI|nr:DUF1294 domain-containing protein [Edaphobacillus lindanitolerans]SIT84777.1 Uncharacterized membrane protein YsdA, DUF1294 family [Edaphobacillus lindanitolerans]
MENALIAWIGIMSVYGFILMGLDKRRAKRGEWRIPERTLWTVALFGGGIGCYLGMQTFRHKTRHTSFRLGFLILALLYVGAGIWLKTAA